MVRWHTHQELNYNVVISDLGFQGQSNRLIVAMNPVIVRRNSFTRTEANA